MGINGFYHPGIVVSQVVPLIPILRNGWLAGRRSCVIVSVCDEGGVVLFRVPLSVF
jgi:hypothetical protein